MENKVLATVNGIEITKDIIDSTIKLLAPERRSYFDSDFAKKQLLEQLVSVELINAFGTELGMDADPLYLSQVEQAVKDIKYSFTMNKIFSAITIEEDEAKRVFEENPDRYQAELSVKASHILVADEKLAEDLIGKIES
jgi:peptidyl-prolyl cis-trans isomerase C